MNENESEINENNKLLDIYYMLSPVKGPELLAVFFFTAWYD